MKNTTATIQEVGEMQIDTHSEVQAFTGQEESLSNNTITGQQALSRAPILLDLPIADNRKKIGEAIDQYKLMQSLEDLIPETRLMLKISALYGIRWEHWNEITFNIFSINQQPHFICHLIKKMRQFTSKEQGIASYTPIAQVHISKLSLDQQNKLENSPIKLAVLNNILQYLDLKDIYKFANMSKLTLKHLPTTETYVSLEQFKTICNELIKESKQNRKDFINYLMKGSLKEATTLVQEKFVACDVFEKLDNKPPYHNHIFFQLQNLLDKSGRTLKDDNGYLEKILPKIITNINAISNINLEYGDESGNKESFLTWAIRKQPFFIKPLIEAGAYLDPEDKTILKEAFKHTVPSNVLVDLIEAGAYIDPKDTTILREAFYGQITPYLRCILIESGLQLKFCHRSIINESLATIVVHKKKKIISNKILDCVDLNATDQFGETALLELMTEPINDTTAWLVKCLIAKGANINQANVYTGETPLQRGIMRLKESPKDRLELEKKLIEELLEKGAIMDDSWCEKNIREYQRPNKFKYIWAAIERDVREDEYMYYNILYLKLHNKLTPLLEGPTNLLLVRIYGKQYKLAQLLIDSGADVNKDDPLDLVIEALDDNATKMLIDAKAKINLKHFDTLFDSLTQGTDKYFTYLSYLSSLTSTAVVRMPYSIPILKTIEEEDSFIVEATERFCNITKHLINNFNRIPESIEEITDRMVYWQNLVSEFQNHPNIWSNSESCKYLEQIDIGVKSLENLIDYLLHINNSEYPAPITFLIAEGVNVAAVANNKKSKAIVDNDYIEGSSYKRQKADQKSHISMEHNDDPMGSEAPSEVNDAEPLQNNDDPMNSEATHAAIESVDPAVDVQPLGKQIDSSYLL